jgi:very-short-patch-repair endonuclease
LTGEGEGGGDKELSNFANLLRKRTTEAEKLLWKHVRARQLDNFKFRRQQQIDNYIVDFVCFEKRLVIELDGGQHSVQTQMDLIRDNYLRDQGFKILRFWNNEIMKNINGVMEVIRETLISSPSPYPSPARGEGFLDSCMQSDL